MEVNTAEKISLSVDGTKTLCSCTNHPEGNSSSRSHSPFPNSKVLNCESSNVFLQYKNAAQYLTSTGHKFSTVSKPRMGIIKTVTSRWRHQEKTRVVRSSSAGHRHSSSDRLPRRSLDPLVALLLHRQTGSSDTHYEGKDIDLPLTKPRHYRRIVVLGAPKVGKTAILRRFFGDGFEDHYEPTSEDFHSKLYHIRGETYQIDILDASKERDFPAKRRLSILTGDIFLLVFSVEDRGSFNEVCSLRKEIVSAKTRLAKSKENAQVPIIICGNKIDLDSQMAVSQSEMYQMLGEESVIFEVSAKNNTNLEEMFGALAELGGLPTETRPSLHRDISIRSYHALSSRRRSKKETRALALDEPCGAVCPLARRPSFNSDLRRVLGSSATKKSTPIERCQIQ
ncbi:GTP-binding protein Rhes [Chanos chanos]|uniref:GTP-binding protein Rhes n=1 Tax=Chanos chanos TaxID=29144 RepID=A0A6J2WQ46_CHACN|nr:GTP-binding protein Rhes-like [Chanos chanos]